jgi:hypothetical protein
MGKPVATSDEVPYLPIGESLIPRHLAERGLSNLKKINESFGPGSFGFHELLDRAYMIAQQFSEYVAEHESANHPKLREKINEIESELFDLYQRIGDLHE